MIHVSAVRHQNGKKNLLHVYNTFSVEEARLAVHVTYPRSTILVSVCDDSKVTPTEKART